MSYKNEIFLESLFCIEEACKRLNLNYEFFGNSDSAMEVFIDKDKSLFFYQNQNPFNSSICYTICKDKILNYEFFLRFNIPTPDSLVLFNPLYSEELFDKAQFKDVCSFYEHAIQKWKLPFILKKAISSLSQHVHLITNQEDANKAWSQYFFENSPRNSLIAQEFVAGREFRVVAVKGKTLLAYEKVSDESLLERSSHNDLNPLHSGRPSKITDPQIIARFSDIVEKVYNGMKINFCGLDIILDKDNNPHVLEVNANPACFFYNSEYGREDFTAIYQECLQGYLR